MAGDKESSSTEVVDTRLAVLCLGVWLHAASSMLAATTLPSAVREFGGSQLIGWAFALYLLGSILAGAGTGILARRFSLKFGLVGAALIYLVGCAICALAPDMIVVLIGRLFQGIGGGFMIALTYVGLSRWFEEKMLPRLLAIVSAVWSVSAFCGPLVGGTFATFGNWRWAFWAFVLQAALFIVACLILMPKETARESNGNARFPFMRLFVLSLSILSVALAGAQPGAITSPVLCLFGVLLLWMVFYLDAKSRKDRMFPTKPMNPASPVGAGLLFVLFASISTMTFLVYGPILLETIHGVTPLTAGYIVAFESIAWGIGAVVVSKCSEEYDVILIRTGSVLISAGILGFALWMSTGPLWLLLICAAGQGVGFGISWGFIVKRITSNASAGEQEIASSSVPTLQQIGFAVGAAAAGIVANIIGFGDNVTVAIALDAAPWIFAAFLPFALVSNFAAWRLTTPLSKWPLGSL